MSRVLVTGGTGFIGSRAVAALRERGHDVHAPPRQAADLLEPDAPRRLVEELRPELLLHCAWDVSPGYWSSPSNADWVAASVELARAFGDAGGTRAAFVGSAAEYDWSGDGWCSEHSTPLEPATPYGKAKLELFEAVCELVPSVAWGRVFFLYGEGERPERLVPAVARALLSGEQAPVSSGEQQRDFMHVEDVGAALAALLDSQVEGAVNVATGQPVAVRRIVELVGEAAGRPQLIRWGELPQRPGDPPLLAGDSRRLREEVGFAPQVGLEEGLRRAVAYWRSQVEATL